jgi:hypothetical protein
MLAVLSNLFTLSGPFCINGLLSYLQQRGLENPTVSRAMAYGFAGILTGSYILKSVLLQNSMHLVNFCAIKTSNVLTTCLFHKILKLSQSSFKYNSPGSLVTLFSVDIKTI